MPWKLTNGSGHECFKLRYESAGAWVQTQWSGPQSYLSVLRAGDTILRALQKYPCSGLLNDERTGAPPLEQAYEWLIFDWVPQAVAQGLRRVAHVVQQQVLETYGTDIPHVVLAGQLQVRVFTELDQAQAWLRDAPAPTLSPAAGLAHPLRASPSGT